MQHQKLLAAVSAALVMVVAADAKTTRRTGSSHNSKAAHGKTGHAKAGHGKTAASRRPAGPARQAAPSRERYVEIQRVLTEKGYYSGPVNGDWGAESVDALKRFQADQKLVADGKLGALSLIALGLGPNRDTVADVASKPATEPPTGP